MANTFLNTGMATSNPQANVEQVQNGMPTSASQNGQISPITIPIQIQPQLQTNTVGQVQPTVNNNLQANQQVGQAPTPQTYQNTNTNNNVVDFNQIYSAYQGQYGNTYNTNNNTASGIKKTSIGSTIVTPTAQNLNSVQGQYQSAYSDTINGLISEMINQMNNGFTYNAMQDNALRVASEYAANTSLQSLAGSGVLNSSATAERVARIVSELVPVYEEKAHSRWIEYLGQLADTAQVVMNYDSQQFQYWKDAKDREFQEKEFEYKKQQDAITNAWKRVDELGFVDNEASAILGVKVGTKSWEARKVAEQREFELQKMREQAEIEQQNTIALYKLKSELDIQQSKIMADYNANIEKNLYNYKTSVNTTASKELTQYEYDLQNQNNTSKNFSTYEQTLVNRWGEKDPVSGYVKLTDNDTAWKYLTQQWADGKLTDNDYSTLIARYGITAPADSSLNLSSTAQEIFNSYKNLYNSSSSKSTALQNKIKSGLSNLQKSGALTSNEYEYILKNLGF